MQFALGTYLQNFGSWRRYRHQGSWGEVEEKRGGGRRIDQNLTFKQLHKKKSLKSAMFNKSWFDKAAFFPLPGRSWAGWEPAAEDGAVLRWAARWSCKQAFPQASQHNQTQRQAQHEPRFTSSTSAMILICEQKPLKQSKLLIPCMQVITEQKNYKRPE